MAEEQAMHNRLTAFQTGLEAQHRRNKEKWGEQDPLILIAVLAEETGEVARAVLELRMREVDAPEIAHDKMAAYYECLDAAAVCMEIATTIVDYQATRRRTDERAQMQGVRVAGPATEELSQESPLSERTRARRAGGRSV